MTPTTRKLCIASLEKMLERKEVPAFALNTARARLNQLRAQAASLAAVAQPRKAPAPAVDRFAVMQDFLALHKRKAALLHRWGRLKRENHARLLDLVALLPDLAPTSDDEAAWQNFAARVAAAKSETI